MTRFAFPLLCCLIACAPETSKPTRAGARRDALSTGVVISEVYGGAGVATSTYKHDFVELFNRGTVAVDVSNWSVQYAGATNGGWQPTSLGSFGLLQPGQSLLVRLGTTSTAAGIDLPVTHDVSGMTLMSATSGKVALVNTTTGLSGNCPSSGTIVDLVGYGPQANCSEASPTGVTAGNTSVSRIDNGCAETDSNANDFTVSGPLPRNSSATAIPCGSNPVIDAGVVDAGTNPVDSGVPFDAGINPNCTMITNFTTVASAGGFEMSAATAFGEITTQNPASADGGMNVLTLETYFGFGLMLPGTETYTSASDFNNCEICPKFYRGCDATSCAKEYYAQSGTGSVTVATRNELSGTFTGSTTQMQFVEWDFENDVPVVGGECVVLPAQSINASWGGAGGAGGGGGSMTGGGMGGGTGGGSGGGSGADAGEMEADAGTGGGGGGGKLGGMSGCGCTTGGEASLAFLLFALLRRRRG
jgi:uncharacterized protein (TIGR03382 family)